jgi:predicted nucleotide-binding protein
LDDPQASLASIVQDCLTLARIAKEAEWELYFDFQLSGVTLGEAGPPRWKGDPNTLSWQPAVVFAEERKGRDGMINAHTIEAIESMSKGLEQTLDNPSTTSPLSKLLQNDYRFMLDAMEQRQESQKILVDMQKILLNARKRTRQFASLMEAKTSPETSGTEAIHPCVFIGHGQSSIWRELSSFLHERLGLNYEEFNRTSPAGKSTTERLREMLSCTSFAFLVFTAEDQQADGSMRARQNVIHEAGLFQGRLGFERAIILLEEGCQEFSNIIGLGQIRFPKGQIMAKAEEIRQVLEREGLLQDDKRSAYP